MKKCKGEGQSNCDKCGQRQWMCFLYEVDEVEGCYCRECAEELEKMTVDYKNSIIQDQKDTISRLQDELKQKSDFEFKLIRAIIQLTSNEGIIADIQQSQDATSIYLEKFKVALTALLISYGFSYEPQLDIDNYKDKKFFAFKLLDVNNETEFYEHLEYISNIVGKHIDENRTNRHATFKIVKLENLHDKDEFTDLVRGLVYMRYLDEA